METCTPSRSNAPRFSSQNQAYQTTYNREFISKKSSSVVKDKPFGQRFLIGCPFQLSEPVGDSLYTMDFINRKNVQRGPFFHPNTSRAHRPNPHKEFPYSPRRSESLCDLRSEETTQALRNQLDSTYQVDYTGALQGFHLPLAFDRSHPFWRHRAQHTLDSEYRHAYQIPPKEMLHTGGRYGSSCRRPANAIVPQTAPLWKKKSSQSVYGYEISQKTPSVLHMQTFVDSLNEPMV